MRKELKNSSVRDVVDFLDYDVDPDVWINRLVSSIAHGTYEPDPPRRFTFGQIQGLQQNNDASCNTGSCLVQDAGGLYLPEGEAP